MAMATAMARAALRGALCLRPSSSSSPFRRLLGSESTDFLLAPLDIDDASLKPLQEQSVKAEADLPKLRANDLRRFLEEQTNFFIELQNQLKDQRVLLSLICEEVSFYKSEPKTRKEVVVSATRVSSHTNAESVSEAASEMCDTKAEKLQPARTSLCERTSENGEPVLPSEKNTKNDACITKKGFDADKLQHPPWPEWELFLDHLRPYASVKEGKPKDKSCELFDDTALLKHALVKFAQTHEAAFRTLSRENLVMLVQHVFPSMDERTAVGKKRLRNYLVMDESEVTQAKLTDVVRLIYRAVRSIPSLGSALPNELKSSIVHLLQELISVTIPKHGGSSGTVEGIDQKISKGDEFERVNNMTNTVDGEAVLPMTSPSINQDESTLMTSAALELPKFGSLKERVDARRARLARESVEKEAAKSLLPPLLTKELEQKTFKACSTQMDKSKANREVVRNFRAFDAIIESEDSDGSVRSKSQPKRVSRTYLSSLVRKNGNTLFLQNEGAQRYSGQWRNNGVGKASGG